MSQIVRRPPVGMASRAVNDEVHDDLFELSRIGFNSGSVSGAVMTTRTMSSQSGGGEA